MSNVRTTRRFSSSSPTTYGSKGREARPQAGVRLERLPGLEADEVRERVGHRHGVTPEQEVRAAGRG